MTDPYISDREDEFYSRRAEQRDADMHDRQQADADAAYMRAIQRRRFAFTCRTCGHALTNAEREAYVDQCDPCTRESPCL